MAKRYLLCVEREIDEGDILKALTAVGVQAYAVGVSGVYYLSTRDDMATLQGLLKAFLPVRVAVFLCDITGKDKFFRSKDTSGTWVPADDAVKQGFFVNG